MPQVKEHRAPVRYSLTADEASQLGQRLRAKGGMTDAQVRRQAKAMGCATKPIYALATKMGLEIRCTDPFPKKRKTARERAEEVFSNPISSENRLAELSTEEENAENQECPAAPAERTRNDPDFDAAVELLAEEKRRIADAHRAGTEELAGREAAFVETAAEMQTRLEEEQERARAAIQRTAQLRRDTRADRELIEDLRGQITQMKIERDRLRRSTKRAENVAREHKEELKASMARERRLLDALAQSEADLAHCRGSA